MRHILFGNDPSKASVAILVKESSFHDTNIRSAYIDPLGANPEGFIAYSLYYDDQNKVKADDAKVYLDNVLHSIKQLGIKTILISDSKYFKFLTGMQKTAMNYLGYGVPSKLDGYVDEFTVFYAPNYQAAKYNPNTAHEIDTSLYYFKNYLQGTYEPPGKHIIHSAQYPMTLIEIEGALKKLMGCAHLTVDIEARSLEFWNCGIATISFAWDKHNFISIPVDRGFFTASIGEVFSMTFGEHVKILLRKFFEEYSKRGGILMPHNANYDFKILTYELWMDNLQDYPGMIDGIQVLTKNFEDTKIITYLATNNAVENVLKLKVLSKEYLGNYAEDDIKNTDKIPLHDLLLYNGKDCLATWFVYEKHWTQMITDNQYNIYVDLFKPSVVTLLATELSGIPIFPKKVAAAKKELTDLADKYKDYFKNHKLMREFQMDVRTRKAKEFTEAAKKKVFDIDDPRVARLEFNPNSPQQVGDLLFNYLKFPVLDKTDTGEPATGIKTLEKLIHHTKNTHYINILTNLIGLSQVDKILSSFIPAFENAVQMPDGSWRLYGNFNLGGTVSGRLSSSNPNLQNIPAHSIWAKLIKQCFGCVDGWLFGGADFNSLEDMVSALTTRDTNKMAVYLDGYDGHCLRAFHYFRDQMPDIVESVKSINSITIKYPKQRQDSKTPTFALTYQGTYHTLMTNLGLSETEAKRIESSYHELYKESDEWVGERLQKATEDGYVTGAFGLRLRTPILKMNGPGKLNYKAAAEGRTAGNMLGQSYGMLNSRAANEFRERVWASPYKYEILLCGQIHDACYLFWKNTAGVTKWINDNLIDCMEWVGLVELQHPVVKIGAELDIFYPDWSNPVTLDNYMSLKDIITRCKRKP